MFDFKFLVLSMLLLSSFLYSQSNERSQGNNLGMLGIGEEISAKIPDLKTSDMFTASVDENEYVVDAGDVFIIKIDVKGPAFKLFNSIVTPDGYLVLPEAPTIFVKGLYLKDAKNKINSMLTKEFSGAKISVHLFQVHPITVTILGAVPMSASIRLNSSHRLFDAITELINPSLNDTSSVFDWNNVSFRDIEIKRQNESQKVDLLKFKLMGDRKNNPYLRDQDIVYIQYRDSVRYSIEVSGAVGKPVIFEYKKKDDLGLAIKFASGLLPFADSTRLELVRFTAAEGNKFENKILIYPQDSSYTLQPDDRIFVREKPNFNKKSVVHVEGEVKYPGKYAIENGQTTLTDILHQAGGFTNLASLELATLQRKKDKLLDDVELERLNNISPAEMTAMEASYFRMRTRENRYLVDVNFNFLFGQNDSTRNVVLLDQDLILVPPRTFNVFVSGGVNVPGNYKYNPEWTCLDYIEAAGGYTPLAREGWTRVINRQTGKWLDAEDETVVNEGDIVFVPEKEPIDWYQFFIESLGIVSQVAAVVLIVISVSK